VDSKKDIPLLPDCNVTTAASKLIVQNMDPFFNTKVSDVLQRGNGGRQDFLADDANYMGLSS
jgi:hypothetical protein